MQWQLICTSCICKMLYAICMCKHIHRPVFKLNALLHIFSVHDSWSFKINHGYLEKSRKLINLFQIKWQLLSFKHFFENDVFGLNTNTKARRVTRTLTLYRKIKDVICLKIQRYERDNICSVNWITKKWKYLNRWLCLLFFIDLHWRA